MDAAFTWHQPVPVRFGPGCLSTLARELGDRSALVLAFEPASRLGLQFRLAAELGSRLLHWVTVPEGLPTLAMARELSTQVWPWLGFGVRPAPVLLAIGGGSTLDLAKLLRCRPPDDDFQALAAALRGRAPWPVLERATLWVAPTTAGTGSEVTRWATIWDTDERVATKRSLDEAWGWPDRAWVDPELTLSAPAAVIRDGALDALAHALESLWNRHASPLTDTLAVGAARRIVQALPAALARPQDPDARTALSLGALEAGLAFSQTRTALAHALSYAVTLEQGLAHGAACALWLPTAWRLAAGRSAHVDARLHEVFDGVGALESWLQGVGAGLRPADIGITDVQARVQQALHSPRGRNFIGAAMEDDT